MGKQRHESVGQVLGLPRSSLEWEDGTRTWRALNALLSPSASPEGSGEPQKIAKQGTRSEPAGVWGSRSENHPWYQVWLRVLLGPNPSLESIQG